MMTMEDIAKAAKLRILDRPPLAENLTACEYKELSRKMKVLHDSLASIDESLLSAALSRANPAATREVQVVYISAVLALREMNKRIAGRYLIGDEFETIIVYWCDYHKSIEADSSYALIRSLASVHCELSNILDDIGSMLSACQN